MDRIMERKAWGKRGGISSLKKHKVLFCTLAFLVIFTFSFQQLAFAARSRAGGGEMASFSFGKWAAAQGIGIGFCILGSAIGQGITTAANGSGFSTGFNYGIGLGGWGTPGGILNATTGIQNVFTLPQIFTNYAVVSNIGLATGQLGSALGMNPKASYLMSGILGGALGGALNPGGAMGMGFLGGVTSGLYSPKGILSGMALGAISGGVEGGILSALSDKKGQLPFWAGPVAGLAGGLTSSFIVGGFTQGNTFSLKGAFSNAFGPQNLVPALAGTALGIGVGAITSGTKDPQDRQLVNAAFSGLYPIVGALSNVTVSALTMPKVPSYVPANFSGTRRIQPLYNTIGSPYNITGPINNTIGPLNTTIMDYNARNNYIGSDNR